MFGNVIRIAILIFLGSFAVGTTIMILKELKARRKRAKASVHTITDEKEVDSSN